MPLIVQGLIGTAIIMGTLSAWMILVAIVDDYIDRWQSRKTQKNALAGATTNARRK